MSRILYNFTLSCRAANIRGQLKHTYLTNKICLKLLPEDLLDSLLYKERDIPQHQSIRRLIIELLGILSSIEQGFSPAQLLDQLSPFQELSCETREKMKGKVHQQFLLEFRSAERHMHLEQASKIFLESLDSFLMQDQEDTNVSKAAMERVQETARGLIRELETLPKGIWLWKTK